MNLALFDFDGTLTHADSFTAFVLYAAGTRRLVSGTVALLPLIARYRLGRVRGPEMRAAMVRRAFGGRRFAEVLDLGERFSSDVLPELVRPRALERLRWHRARGDEVAVVSASLSLYLAPWCLRHGVDLLCSELEVQDGVLTGAYAGLDCTGDEKARRVRARYALDRYDAVYAYGDTVEDRELLALAGRAFHRWAAFD